MKIGDLDTSDHLLVVAELGNNHEGSLGVARELVRQAAEAGADAVKLQTFAARRFVRPRDAERLARLTAFELSPEAVEELGELAHELGLLFLSTPLDLESVELLEPLVDAYKIASGDNDFLPLLERVADTGKPVIVSAGLVDLAGVEAFVEAVEARWRERGLDGELAVLHCVSAYPAPADQLNLASIPFLAEALVCTVGYSDHSLGIEACVCAAALSARIVEKHFTLDHDFSDFRDHRLSAEPAEMREMVERIRGGEGGEVPQEMLGEPGKTPQPSELGLEREMRRSIVASAELRAGHVIAADDLTWMRPRDGLAPGREKELIGATMRRPVALGEAVMPEDVGR